MAAQVLRLGVPELRRLMRGGDMLLLASISDMSRWNHLSQTAQVLRVGVPELRRLMRGGDMLLPSVTTCHWALEWLEERGML